MQDGDVDEQASETARAGVRSRMLDQRRIHFSM